MALDEIKELISTVERFINCLYAEILDLLLGSRENSKHFFL